MRADRRIGQGGYAAITGRGSPSGVARWSGPSAPRRSVRSMASAWTFPRLCGAIRPTSAGDRTVTDPAAMV